MNWKERSEQTAARLSTALKKDSLKARRSGLLAAK